MYAIALLSSQVVVGCLWRLRASKQKGGELERYLEPGFPRLRVIRTFGVCCMA